MRGNHYSSSFEQRIDTSAFLYFLEGWLGQSFDERLLLLREVVPLLFVDGGGQSIICIICDCPELALGELCEAASNLGLGRWFLHIPDRLESRAF